MIAETALSFVRARPGMKARLGNALRAIGYDSTDWSRVEMYRQCFAFVERLGPRDLDVVEISAGPQWSRNFRFRSYTGTSYPDFDICSQTLPARFDLVIADQVFEHLKWPYRAARNVFAMLRPGGHFLITVPFLVRVHKSPIDCCRWTEDGLFYFLQECGFPADGIVTAAWGNRACLVANLKKWRKRGFFGSLANEPDFPVVVWAFARKPQDRPEPSPDNATAKG
ncbi:MAG TPA: methyltransferase domain-containing protein [Stellaceae bacterium]|nr:methyltransferase domain-containing protein [Stellaceae bacterium]